MAIPDNLPFKGGMSIGVGINSVTGKLVSKGVTFSDPKPSVGDTGQRVFKDMMVVNTFQDLQESLGIDVNASASYGLFSADDKFNYTKNSKYNSKSTYAVARCIVHNPPLSIDDAKLKDEAGNLLTQGNDNEFADVYGDCFVRGIFSGGELYTIFQFDSNDSSEQTSVSNSFSGSVSGLAAGGSLSVDVNTQKAIQNRSTKITLTQIQIGGSGMDFSLNIGQALASSDPATAMIQSISNLMDHFAEIVKGNPVAASVIVQPYTSLLLPKKPNFEDLLLRKTCLDQVAANYQSRLTLLNDLTFISLNPDKFDGLPEDGVLKSWIDFFSNQITNLLKGASSCVDDIKQCVVPALDTPADFSKFSKIVRKNGPALVKVPAVVGMDSAQAQSQIKAAGFTPVVQFEVTSDAKADFSKISRTSPTADQLAALGSNVILILPMLPVIPHSRLLQRMSVPAATMAHSASSFTVGSH